MLKLPRQGLQICIISLDFVCSEIKFEVHLFQRNKHQKNDFWPFKLRWPIYMALLLLLPSIVVKINKN